jgi:RNA polymerase sigma factor (sigma-70 family)
LKAEPDSDVISLRYYFGLSRDEIAQAFGISLSRVNRIMEEAKKVLKEILS